MSAVKPAWLLLFCILFWNFIHAVPFLHDEDHDSAIVPVMDTQGMQWKNDLHYLTYLCMDDLGQYCFRTYPFTAISMPGIYKLADNVTNEITISASNVTLDLNGCTVSGGTNGIVITSGFSHVTIKNGKIDTVSSDGIQVGSGCSDIQIYDVEVKNALRAIDCEQVSNSVIKNCEFNLSTTGLELDECYNVTVRNCTARANTHAGYDLLTSTTCSLLECQALSTGDGNSNIQSEVFGFVAKDGNGNLFERCIANATQALSVTGSDSIVAGFALRGDEGCTKIIDSEASNSETNANGVSVPYGVWLEGQLSDLATIDSVSFGSTQWPTDAVAWSHDGNYLAVGRGPNNSGALNIYEFDRQSGQLVLLDSMTAHGDRSLTVQWSPDDNYLIEGGDNEGTDRVFLFEFDRSTNKLSVLNSFAIGNVNITQSSWSFDGNYFVTVNSPTTGGINFRLFRFDAAAKDAEQLLAPTTATAGARGVGWSPGNDLVALGDDSGDLILYRYDRATNTLTELDSVTVPDTVVIDSLRWSFDGNYIAVQTQAGTNTIHIYQVENETLILRASADGNVGSVSFGNALTWSPDGKYVTNYINGVQTQIAIYQFDRGSNELFSVATKTFTVEDVHGIDWSPDGEYIAVGADTTAAAQDSLYVIRGIEFPENNVVKNNTLYCNSGAQLPSGIGISGSSISNSIIQNTAFNSPIPSGQNEPVLETNYVFVTNVFNQMFGDAPTALQNISLSGLNPLLNRYDIPTKLLRLEALAESLIDNLL